MFLQREAVVIQHPRADDMCVELEGAACLVII